MPSPAPAFGRASLGLLALDSPAWALRRGLASLEGDLPAAIVRIDANATATEVRSASALAASAGAAVAWIPEAAPTALAETLARACPDVVLDSALCGDELVSALLERDERVRPRRPAHRSVARGDRTRQRWRGHARRARRRRRLGRGADARRLADWLSAGVKVPVWIVGDVLGIQGVRLRFGRHERVVPPPALEAERDAGRCARSRRLRARARAGAAGLRRPPAPRRLTALSAPASPGC